MIMRKWTYLVAMLMLVGATTTFTGCIDTDEPAGIEELRGAKAELLRAKAAVEAAKTAQVEAEAAYKQAEAELVKAEAQAALLRAEYEKAIAEANSAAEIQRIQAEIQRIQAETAQILASAEAQRQAAEDAHLQAMIALQQMQATLADSQLNAIADEISAYETATANYYDALETLRLAERNVNKQLAVLEETEASKNLLTRELQKEVKIAEAGFQGQKDALAAAEAEYAAAMEMKPHALAEKLDSVYAKQEALGFEVVDLFVEVAETVNEFHENGRFDEIKDLKGSMYELSVTPQDIAAVEFDFGDGSGFPAYVSRGIVELPAEKYSFLEDTEIEGTGMDAYNERMAVLEECLDEFNSWTRDDNDDAWTNERLIVLDTLLARAKADVEPYEKAWEEAVAAFNTNKFNESDPSKISGYDSVVVKLADFNKATAKATAYQDTIQGLLAEHKADLKAYNDANTAANKTYSDATTAAVKAQEAALKNLDKTVEAKTKALKAVADADKKAYDDALKAFNEYTGSDQAELMVLAKKVNDTKKAYETSSAAWAEYSANGTTLEQKTINDTYESTIVAAYTAKETAINAADSIYDVKWDAVKGTAAIALDNANDSLDVAVTAIEAPAEALKVASKAYNGNVPELEDEFIPIDLNIIDDYSVATYNEEKKYNDWPELKISTLLTLDKGALVDVVIQRSSKLYGAYFDGDRNVYGDFEARLLPIDMEAVAAAIRADETIESLEEYIDICELYGITGEIMALEEYIRIAKSWLNNDDKISAKIAQAENAIAVLDSTHAAYIKSIEDIDSIAEAKVLELEADIIAAAEPIFEKIAEIQPLSDLYDAYFMAIAAYRALGEDVMSEAQLSRYVEYCKSMINVCKEDLYDAETALLQAQANLSNWNAGNISQLDIYNDQLEDAKALVERKSAELEAAEARLEAAIELLGFSDEE